MPTDPRPNIEAAIARHSKPNDVGYACFGGSGHQFRMTGIYRSANEAQLFCQRNWIVRPVGLEELRAALGVIK